MSRSRGETPPSIASLLEAERMLVPEPEVVRRRVLGRARAAVAGDRCPVGAVDARPPRRFPLGRAVAAIALLVGLTAAAYELGYRRSKATSKAIVPELVPAPAPVPALAEAAALSEPSAELPAPPPRRPTRSRPAASATTAAGDAYGAELRLLRPAQMALGRSAFTEALALVDEHRRRHPMGHLAEEREALRVKVLLGLDRRDEARRAAAAFRARFPNSALLARMQAMLEAAP